MRTYRGFKLELVIDATWIRTETRPHIGVPRNYRSKISGWLAYYPDGDGQSKWCDTLDDAKEYIDEYLRPA